MSFRTITFVVTLNMLGTSLFGCSVLGTNSNSPKAIASNYSELEYKEQYEEASALSTESNARHLNWLAKQKSQQKTRLIEPWQNFKATSRNETINNDVAKVEILTEGSFQNTPHWCLNNAELKKIEDTWKVDNVTTVKCGSNSKPPK